MPTIGDILATKGAMIHRIRAHATVLKAAQMMNRYHIGALVVVDNEDMVVGMFSERDILTRIVGKRRDPASTPVSEVMTHPVICCAPRTKVDEARTVFKTRRIRHMPVVNENDELVGIVSIGDLNAFSAEQQECTIRYMNEYFYGRV